MVAPIGFIKNIAVPKLLGGLTSHVPGKLCLLTTLHYSVSEAPDNIQTVVETTTGEAMERTVAIQRTANIFDTDRPYKNRIVQVLSEPYSLLVIRLSNIN